MNKNKGGRPTKYTPEIGEFICQEIANGKSLVRILKQNEGLPNYATIANWLIRGEKGEEPFKTFLEMYGQAREMQSDYLADEILDIADNTQGDTACDDKGNEYCNKEWVLRSRLRVDSRKWIAAKLRPRKYGDFNRSEMSGPEGGPIQTQSLFLIDAGSNPYKSDDNKTE